ncbi:competence protein ComFB [Gammaproteobacteria bacterium]
MFSSIHNYYEQVVLERIQIVMRERDEVADQELMEDIACIALNHLPPRYIRHNVDMASNITDREWEEMHALIVRIVNDAIDFAKRRQVPR